MASIHYDGDIDRISYLLKNGGDVKQTDYNGDTPIHHAAGNGHTQTIAFLVENGGDVKQTDNDGNTPIHHAAYNGHTQTIAFLVENGGDVKQTNNNGSTPIHYAAHNGHTQTIAFLVENGGDVKQTNNNGWTPIHYAAQNGHTQTIAFLVENGGDVKQTNNNGYTPIHKAAENGHTQTIAFLVENGGDVKQTNNDGNTPIHYAAYNGHTQTIAFLVENGGDVKQTNNYGNTPIHSAAYNGHTQTIAFLVENGGDLFQHNNEGETPLMRAKNNNHKEAASYLRICELKVTIEASLTECKQDISNASKRKALIQWFGSGVDNWTSLRKRVHEYIEEMKEKYFVPEAAFALHNLCETCEELFVLMSKCPQEGSMRELMSQQLNIVRHKMNNEELLELYRELMNCVDRSKFEEVENENEVHRFVKYDSTLANLLLEDKYSELGCDVIRSFRRSVQHIKLKGKEYAAKRLFIGEKEDARVVIRQLDMLVSMRMSPYVAELKHIVFDESVKASGLFKRKPRKPADHVFLIFRWYGGGSLREWLNEIRPYDELRNMFFHVLCAVNAFHENGFVHNDLKPENVVLNDEMTPILIDFDTVRANDTTVTRFVAGGRELAPEERQGSGKRRHSFAIDMWCCGWMMAESFISERKGDDVDWVDFAERYLVNTDPLLKDVVLRLLQHDALDRLSSKSALDHAYFSGLDGLRYAPLSNNGVAADRIEVMNDKGPFRIDRPISGEWCGVRDFERGGKRILLLDGGGTRGIIHLEILKELEQRLNMNKRDRDRIPIYEFFDLIAGTSIGGILAICLGYCGWSLEYIASRYYEMVDSVFACKRSGWRYLTGKTKLYTYKAEDTVLNIFPRDLQSPASSGKVLPHVMVVCNEFKAGGEYKPVLFTTYEANDDDKYTRFPLCSKNLWIAARATSAAPTYFKPMEVYDYEGTKRTLEDGGIASNCPINEAMYDATKILGWNVNDDLKCVVSLGTGRTLAPPPHHSHGSGLYTQIRRVGLHARHLIANSERLYGDFLKPDNVSFFRLNPMLHEKFVDEMTESNHEVLKAMGRNAVEFHKAPETRGYWDTMVDALDTDV